MTDINMEAAIRLSAEDRASQVIRGLQRDVDALRRSLAALSKIKLPTAGSAISATSPASQALDFKAGAQAVAAARLAATDRQATRQREADVRSQERNQRRLESDALRALRDRDRANAKALRDQLAGQRLLEREARRAAAQVERDQEAYIRRQAIGIRYLSNLRLRHDREGRRATAQAERDVARRGRETWHRGRDAINDTFRPAGIAALAGAAATVAGTRRVLGAERDVDAAEIATRAYGGLNFGAARELRENWAAPSAEALGSDTAKLLTAWTDATKLGIPATGAKAFAELSTQTSEAWQVPFEQVTDIFGTINTLLTSQGQAFDPARLKSVANTLQHLAAKQSTTPEKMISFLQRGAGAAQVLGMSQESGLAFGSASTSLGNQAGQSGRMFDYLASRVIELPRLVKGKGEEAEQARAMVRALGYGSAEAMDKQRRADPDQFLPDFMERFARIKDQRKQDQAIRFFTGREWLGEFGRMVKGADTYREAVKLAKEAKGLDAIGAVWQLHKLKLGFVMKQFRVGWLNILGELGKTLSPLARQAGDYFLEWSSKLRAGGLQARFKAVIDGLLEGFGFKDLPDALTRIFGKPGEGNAGAIEAWRATAREFAAGLRDVFGGIGDFLKSFSGGSPEIIARWTGRILALSGALLVLSPLITTLSGLASGVLALGAAATTVLAAFKVAGLVGVSGTAAGAAGAAAGAGGLAAILGAAVLPVTLVGVSAAVVAAIWGKEALKGAFLGVPSGNGAEPRTPEGDLGAELGAIAPRRWQDTDSPARVEKQSHGGYSGAFDRRLIQPATFRNRDERFGGYNGAFDNRPLHHASFRIGGNAIVSMLQRVSTMAFPGLGSAAGSGMAGVGSGGFGGPSGSGGASAGPTVPGWFNRGNGTQGGGIQGYGANPGAYKPFLDYVAQAEGTAGGKNDGYDVTLANGALLPGGREQDLTKMTLDQIDAMQSGMLRHPGNWWNSSASGRYQIVQKTLRGLRRKFGLRGDQLFDEKLQDQLGAELARARGANAGALGQEWASLKGSKGQRAAQLLGQVSRGASTAPQDRPAGAEGGQYDGLRIKGRQAVAGGGAHLGTTDLAREAQRDLPGGVKHFAAFNDRFHQGTRSKHASGLAFDTTLDDASQSAAAARAMRAKIREAGLAEHEFTVLDEYRNPSARSTGGHLHTQFNSPEAAQRYHEHAERKRQAARMLAGSGKDERFDLHGWMPLAGQTMPGIDPKGFDRGSMIGTAPADLISKPTVGNLLSKMPAPQKAMPDQGAPSGQGRGYNDGMTQAARGGAGATIHVTNVINGAGENPQALAGKIQRHIESAWNYRSHDLEPELT